MAFINRDREGNYWIEDHLGREKLSVVGGEVVLPQSAKYLSIEDDTFEASAIRKFDFSKVEKIGEWAFYCSQIEEADLSNLYICEYAAFSDCRQLRKVVVGSSTIKGHAFSNCSNLETIKLLDGVREIDECAFSDTKIKSLKLPESIRKFDLSAILSTPLEELEIPQNVNLIVTFSPQYKREHFPKLSRKSYLQLLKFYPQAYYELMPSELFGGKFSLDKNYATLCRGAISLGMKARGVSPTEQEEILAKVHERLMAEKKNRSNSHYQNKSKNGKNGK